MMDVSLVARLCSALTRDDFAPLPEDDDDDDDDVEDTEEEDEEEEDNDALENEEN